MPIGNKRIVMYAGALMYEFGIHNLLEAFSIIKDENYELWICGSGDAAEEVKAFEKNDNRITYYGYLNKQETLSLQKKATILINPRPNNGEYTKYSFPSKTVEYMNSGKPIIMYKLDGLPDEYEPYLFIPEDNTPDLLAKKIMEVGSYSNEELYTIGSKAQKWIQENKNCSIQAKKIKNMIKSELFKVRGIQ